MKYTLMLILTLMSGEVERYPIIEGFNSWSACMIAGTLLAQNNTKVVTSANVVKLRTICVLEVST